MYSHHLFSDAVELLSIWLSKSPHTLWQQLKHEQLKIFFERIEYDKDGDKWPFIELLRIFTPFVKQRDYLPGRTLHYLFSNFSFFQLGQGLIREVIAYDKLEECIQATPRVFQHALLKKIAYFCHKNGDVGHDSYHYLVKKGYLFTGKCEHPLPQQFFSSSKFSNKHHVNDLTQCNYQVNQAFIGASRPLGLTH